MTGPSPQLPRQAQGAGSSSRPPWVPDGAAPASGSGSLRRTGQRHRPPEAADDAARPPWYGAASGCPGTGGPCGKVSFPVVGSGFYLAGPSLPPGAGRRQQGADQEQRHRRAENGQVKFVHAGKIVVDAPSGCFRQVVFTGLPDRQAPLGPGNGQLQPRLRSRRNSSTSPGWDSAFFTAGQCLITVPSGPTTTVERIVPRVFLPYIIFSPKAP